MKQKSILSTFWFWLLIIGLLLILIALLIGGGMKKITGWVWAIFIIGAVLAVLGIIFAIYEWFAIQPCQIKQEYSCPETIPEVETPCSKVQVETPKIEKRYVKSTSFIPPNSPLKTPTKIQTNVPQAQRGFSTTSVDLSSIAPSTN
jgi:MFS family permease